MTIGIGELKLNDCFSFIGSEEKYIFRYYDTKFADCFIVALDSNLNEVKISTTLKEVDLIGGTSV